MDLSDDILRRIATALERMAPPMPEPVDLHAADAFVWEAATHTLHPVSNVNALEISLLLGIETAADELLANSRQFATGYSANNALLWGARGMGKSSLIKAIHAVINQESPHAIVLVEIHREDIRFLPTLMRILRESDRRFIVFCDDLSFDEHDASYKSLKTALEGGIEGRPENVLFYATSNRRHLLPRESVHHDTPVNKVGSPETRRELHVSDVIEEKVSLSDRFGLWLGFHSCDFKTYLKMIDAYATHYGLELPQSDLQQQAALWAHTRGARSGRIAWQFIQDLAGKMGKKV